MVAGSAARPDLAWAMVERMEPWIELSERAVEKGLRWLGFPSSCLAGSSRMRS